ncbi:hypothetical protein PINS_up014789 [Pythium insidiosum]|nr:hypothetical protein PINS_up014789 [Pythium insidiosum]
MRQRLTACAEQEDPVVHSGVLMLHRSGARRLGRRAWAPRFVRLTPSRLQLSAVEHGRVRDELSLAHCAIEVLPLCPKSLRPWRFAVSSPADKKRLVLAASSARERSDWIERLACQVHAASRRETVGGDNARGAELLAPWAQTATDCQIFRPRRDRRAATPTLFRRHSMDELASTEIDAAEDLGDDRRFSTGQLDETEIDRETETTPLRALGLEEEEEEKQEEDRVLMALESFDAENEGVDVSETKPSRPLFHYKKEEDGTETLPMTLAQAPSSMPLPTKRTLRSRWFARGHSAPQENRLSVDDDDALDSKPRRYSTGCMLFPSDVPSIIGDDDDVDDEHGGCGPREPVVSSSTASSSSSRLSSSSTRESSKVVDWLARLRDHWRRRRGRKHERLDASTRVSDPAATASSLRHSMLTPVDRENPTQRERARRDWDGRTRERRWRSASFVSIDRRPGRNDSVHENVGDRRADDDEDDDEGDDEEEIVVVVRRPRRRRHSVLDGDAGSSRMRVILEIDVASCRLAIESPRRNVGSEREREPNAAQRSSEAAASVCAA